MATDDSVLLKRAREYDTRALAEIYDLYAESIYRYLYRLVGDANLAEDLTSEAFLRLLQVLGTARAPKEQLQGWLYRVAHNLAIDSFREQAKATHLSLDEELVGGVDSALDKLERRQTRQRLRKAIHRLTPSQQQVLILRFGEGYKLGEIGRLLGKSEGSIKLVQYRAIKRLQKILEQDEREGRGKKES